MAAIDAVDLVVLDAVEAYGLRGILEYMGLRVNWLPIGRPQHLIEALGNQESAAPHVIVCCHGDKRGIVLEKLGPEVTRDEPSTDRLTPDLARRYVRLPGRVVIATGCDTGCTDMGQAFVEGGCDAYIAPDGYPGDALFFLHCLYHDLVRGESLVMAFERARDHDDNTRLFRLHSRAQAVGSRGCRRPETR